MKSQIIKDKNTYFTKRMFYRFLVPSLLSTVGLSLGNIVDALVIGNKMGETGLAAIGLVAPIFMIYNVLDLGLAVGGSVHYTKLLGEGKVKEGVRSFNQMLYAALLISILVAMLGNLTLPWIMYALGTNPSDGILYTAARSYAHILFCAAPLFFLNFLFYYFVRCDDNQRLASIGFIVGNATDIILNFVFVIGLDMGVQGAALATVIGKTVAVLIYLPHLFLKWTIIRIQLMKPDLPLIWNNFRKGFASSSQYIFQFLFFIIMNNLLLRIGGEAGLAVFNVVINISYVLYAIYEGMGATLQPLIGTFYGEKNKKAEKITLSLSLRWGLAIGAIVAAAAALLAPGLGALFGLKGDILATSSIAIRLFGISTLCGGFSIMMSYYYMAVEQGKLVFLINFLRSFAVYICFGILLGSLQFSMFWWTFPATELVSLMIWSLWALRLGKKKKENTVFDETRIFCRTIERNEDFSNVTSEVEEFCNQWSASFSQQYYVNLTVEEICQTIMEKGFPHQKNGYIELTLIAYEDNSFELHLRDNAVQLNLFEMHTKKIHRDNDDGIDNIGIHMVKSKAKEFFYRRYQGFNTLTVKV